MRVLGLDPSLTSFGMAIADSNPIPGRPKAEVSRVRPGAKRGHERLNMLKMRVAEKATTCHLVVMEGLAMHSTGSAILDLAGLHWLIRDVLYGLGVPYAVVPPAVRSKWLTGKGNASKDECLIAAIRRFPVADIHGNDEADALTLAAMGLDWAGEPLVPMPKDRTELLTSVNRAKRPVIEWPQLTCKHNPAEAQ